MSALAMSEADLLDAIRDLARRTGWLVHHETDSRKSPPGFPDLTLVHTVTGCLLFVETKSATGRMRPEQRTWLAALGIKHTAVVWRPEHWHSGVIADVLLGERSVAA